MRLSPGVNSYLEIISYTIMTVNCFFQHDMENLAATRQDFQKIGGGGQLESCRCVMPVNYHIFLFPSSPCAKVMILNAFLAMFVVFFIFFRKEIDPGCVKRRLSPLCAHRKPLPVFHDCLAPGQILKILQMDQK